MSALAAKKEADRRLIWETDLQDRAGVSACLAMNPSLEAINTSFALAVASRNFPLMETFTRHSLKPSGNAINELLIKYAQQCIYPEIVDVLQGLVPSMQIAEHHRFIEELKRRGELEQTGLYLVDLCEQSLLRELAQAETKARHQQTSTSGSKLGSKNNFLVALTSQNWVNDFFLDSVQMHRKYILSDLLRSDRFLRPSQTTINGAFSRLVENYDFSTAIMLMMVHDVKGRPKLSINQGGFNEIFLESVDYFDHIAIEWLLTGHCGWVPTQSAIDSAYERTFNYRQEPGHNFSFTRRQRRGFDDVLSFLASRASPKVVLAMETERKRQEKIRRVNQGVSHIFREEYLDIHAYSRNMIETTSVSAGGGGGTGMNTGDNASQQGGERNVAAVEVGGRDDSESDDEQPAGRVRSARQAPNIHQRKTLNEAIIDHIHTRVPPKVGGYDVSEVSGRLIELVERHIAISQRQDGVRIIGDVLNSRTCNIFGEVLTFLDSLNEEQASRDQVLMNWIQGFLMESIVMHSCIPGALERAVTGLRGIGDRQLNEIFSRAEGPHLVNIFLKAAFNIFFDPQDRSNKINAEKHAKILAAEVIRRGATKNSTDEEIKPLLISFAIESIRDYGVGVDSYMAEVEAVVEAVSDNYETHLQPFVLEMLLGGAEGSSMSS